VQNSGINLDFDLFKKKEKWWTKSMGCGPRKSGRSTGPPSTSQWLVAGTH
jgi:hypothetical protein